jgi:ribosomal protein S18 acetylase RimI-like enzyme
MTTANHFSAHLARIAVHPALRHQHIAANMIIDMFRYFKRRGVNNVTVNTQDNNHASLALYQSMGFDLTGESFPVFRINM